MHTVTSIACVRISCTFVHSYLYPVVTIVIYLAAVFSIDTLIGTPSKLRNTGKTIFTCTWLYVHINYSHNNN